MRPIELMRDVMPIGKFKARASEMIQRVRVDKRALVITLNGEPAAVLICPEDYDRQAYTARVREAIDEGLADAKAGRTISDDEFSKWADARFGIGRESSAPELEKAALHFEAAHARVERIAGEALRKVRKPKKATKRR